MIISNEVILMGDFNSKSALPLQAVIKDNVSYRRWMNLNWNRRMYFDMADALYTAL